uniref:Ig-like domain-containing protein n=1 Tax=Ornithorhynchus anatinus TaxID=9258 RepID=F7F4M7_ORNAN
MSSRSPGLGGAVMMLAAVLASAAASDPEDWGPAGVQYGRLGETVILTCPGAASGVAVSWHRPGARGLPPGSVTGQRELLLPQADPSAEGDYSCRDGHRDGRPLGSVTLRLGHPPTRPTVTCRAADYENFSCSWSPGRASRLPTRYLTSYRKKTLTGADSWGRPLWAGEAGVCEQEQPGVRRCVVCGSEFWSEYRVNVTELNPLGASARLLDVSMQTILRPDPPRGAEGGVGAWGPSPPAGQLGVPGLLAPATPLPAALPPPVSAPAAPLLVHGGARRAGGADHGRGSRPAPRRAGQRSGLPGRRKLE